MKIFCLQLSRSSIANTIRSFFSRGARPASSIITGRQHSSGNLPTNPHDACDGFSGAGGTPSILNRNMSSSAPDLRVPVAPPSQAAGSGLRTPPPPPVRSQAVNGGGQPLGLVDKVLAAGITAKGTVQMTTGLDLSFPPPPSAAELQALEINSGTSDTAPRARRPAPLPPVPANSARGVEHRAPPPPPRRSTPSKPQVYTSSTAPGNSVSSNNLSLNPLLRGRLTCLGNPPRPASGPDFTAHLGAVLNHSSAEVIYQDKCNPNKIIKVSLLPEAEAKQKMQLEYDNTLKFYGAGFVHMSQLSSGEWCLRMDKTPGIPVGSMTAAEIKQSTNNFNSTMLRLNALGIPFGQIDQNMLYDRRNGLFYPSNLTGDAQFTRSDYGLVKIFNMGSSEQLVMALDPSHPTGARMTINVIGEKDC